MDLSKPSDFVIKHGVLEKYKGPGGDVVIPEGVTSIGEDAFYGCKNLTIHCPVGSCAERYAKEYNIPFAAK